MKQQKHKNGQTIKTFFWIKAFVWLLAIMFLFTILSRISDSFTVAKVTISNPASRKIQYTLSAEGRVEKNRELAILTQPELLIHDILVTEGQQVEKGEVIAILDKKQLQERISTLKDERKTLQLQNEAVLENQRRELTKQKQSLARAKSDYAQLREKNKRNIQRAKKKLNEAKINKTATGKLEHELAEIKKEAAETEKAAKRAIEDALTEPAADNTCAINDITIHSLNQQIQKLSNLLTHNGKIFAPRQGTITSLLVRVGEKTTDTALLTMTDMQAGLKFVGQITSKEAKHISVGDSVTLKSTNNELEVPITSLNPDESKENIIVTALLPGNSFFLGETVSMNVMKESENYSCTLPLTALYQDNGKYYVLLMDTENTVLGNLEVARKMEVTVLEHNDTVAALDSEQLTEDSQIITNSDRFIKAGDRIRLQEEEKES